MRTGLHVLLALVAMGCADRTASTSPPEPPLSPRFGGALVAIGEREGELVVHASGELHFHVHRGADLSNAGLTVTMPDRAEHRHAIAMRWADPVQGFVGRMDEATPARGMAEVLLVEQGHRMRASVRVRRVLPRAEHGGSIVAVGDHVVEVMVASDGDAELRFVGEQRVEDAEITIGIPDEEGILHPLALDRAGDRYAGRIEGLTPHEGPLEVIVVTGDGRERIGHGTLRAIEADAPLLPSDLQLELPELGSHLPAVIAVPPAAESRPDRAAAN